MTIHNLFSVSEERDQLLFHHNFGYVTLNLRDLSLCNGAKLSDENFIEAHKSDENEMA